MLACGLPCPSPQTPVLMGHGRHDTMVDVEEAEESVRLLRAAGATCVDFRRCGGSAAGGQQGRARASAAAWFV